MSSLLGAFDCSYLGHKRQVCERLGISRVEIYKRVGKSVISAGKKARLTDAFYFCEKVEKTFWFCNLVRYTEGVPYLSKMVIKGVRGWTSWRSLPVK